MSFLFLQSTCLTCHYKFCFPVTQELLPNHEKKIMTAGQLRQPVISFQVISLVGLSHKVA